MGRESMKNAGMPGRQRGAIAIIVGLSIFVLIGFLALVLDLGRTYIAKTELQNAADAAALAGAKELDGSTAGIDRALVLACRTARQNQYDFATEQVATVAATSDCDGNPLAAGLAYAVSDYPNGPWTPVTSFSPNGVPNPGTKAYLRVDTGLRDLNTWFARIWDITRTRTFGMAVAGRYPPSALAPLFVPAVRRNANQATLDATAPYCNGAIYDPKDKNLRKNTCPYDPVNGGLVPWRVPDNTNNWGFLKANEVKSFPAFNGIVDGVPNPETGNYYIITPKANNDFSNATAWTPGTAWTGNFGFLLPSNDAQTQKELAAALCRGGSVTSYNVPGCAPVHPGGLSGPKIADNINTRFDYPDSQQVQLPHTACPSDTNVFDAGPTNWESSGYYARYAAGSPPLVSPTNYPPGKAGRRLINVYVVDNVWIQGENLPGAADDACYASALTGGSQDAHLVGCAQFFLWSAAQTGTGGKLLAEFVKTLPQSECGSSVLTYTEIRLYQ